VYQVARGARCIYGDDWAARFCMHFLLSYHMGGSAKAATEEWSWDRYKYEFDTMWRGTERRHYRGAQGRNALGRLAAASESPLHAFRAMVAPNYTALRKMFSGGRFERCGFGDYFIWKTLDFQTRVFDNQIALSLEEANVGLPTDPRQAALGLFPQDPLIRCLEIVTDHISNFHLPFGGPGYCGIQEAETVLCMLKGAFITRKHQIGDDIEDKRKALDGWPDLQRLMPFSCIGQYKVGTLHEVEPALVSNSGGAMDA